MPVNNIVEAEGLTLFYGIKHIKPVLHDLHLTVGQGQRVAIIGPSGCGKTSLLHAIAGILPAFASLQGKLNFFGKSQYSKPQQNGDSGADGVAPDGTQQGMPLKLFGQSQGRVDPRCAMIFQSLDLLPWKTAWQNATLGARLQGMDLQYIEKVGEQLFTDLGICQERHKLPAHLSGGEQQRVAIIRALLTNPECILMDEPFSSLDEITREAIQDEVLKLFAKKTLLLVTHSIEEAIYLATHIYWMDKDSGKLVGFYENPDVRDATYRRTKQFYQRCFELREAMALRGEP